jgi:hypothetical protein
MSWTHIWTASTIYEGPLLSPWLHQRVQCNNPFLTNPGCEHRELESAILRPREVIRADDIYRQDGTLSMKQAMFYISALASREVRAMNHTQDSLRNVSCTLDCYCMSTQRYVQRGFGMFTECIADELQRPMAFRIFPLKAISQILPSCLSGTITFQ